MPLLNRQALYLRPDPARVVVRPFKPATEPRDLNPTDKTRANHIVDRVLALDPAGRGQPTGRGSRELSGPPPQSAADIRCARRRNGRCVRGHVAFTRRSDSWSAPISCTSIPSKPRRCSIRASSRIRISRAPRGRAALHPQPARRRRRTCFVPDFPIGIIAADGSMTVDPDGASGLDSRMCSIASPGADGGRCRGGLRAATRTSASG